MIVQLPGQVVGNGSLPYALAAEDFDGDQLLDLAYLSNGEQRVHILRGSGQGTFTEEALPLAASNDPRSLAVGDATGNSSCTYSGAPFVMQEKRSGGSSRTTADARSQRSRPSGCC